ncbi:MAG TPA: hypothetical protein VG963_02375 [Polyangiaceae bacterium]|nr:hypothetical protein [Polyangiaceae bacterium]
MSARFALGLALWSALACGCQKTRCEDLVPASLAGKYLGGGSLGEQRLLHVALDVTAQQVVLRYTAQDGSRIRATYRVKKKKLER